jgi:hypothetical protein
VEKELTGKKEKTSERIIFKVYKSRILAKRKGCRKPRRLVHPKKFTEF